MKELISTPREFDACVALIKLANRELKERNGKILKEDLDFYAELAQETFDANKKLHVDVITMENKRYVTIKNTCESVMDLCQKISVTSLDIEIDYDKMSKEELVDAVKRLREVIRDNEEKKNELNLRVPEHRKAENEAAKSGTGTDDGSSDNKEPNCES